MLVDRRLLGQFDLKLLLLVLMLPLMSLVILYSAGYDPETNITLASWLPVTIRSVAFFKQGIFLFGGLMLMLLVAFIPPTWMQRWAYGIYFIGVLLLVAVLLFGVSSKGSTRWLDLSIIKFQPSEVMKIGIILIMAKYISKFPPTGEGYGFKEMILPFGIFLLPMVLVINQPDLGTALSIGGIGFGMLLFAGIRIKSLLIMMGGLIAACIPAWLYVLRPYQKLRVLTLINPEADPLGRGYHIMQSKIAVGSGQIFGKGFMEGTQSQLEFLPEHTTDFAFSVLSEEWGFVGAIFLLILYFLVFWRLLVITARSRDLFGGLVVFGVATFIFIHFFVNIGMVIGILPVVGIPLPLFSYGGTSLMMNLFAIGLVQSVCMRRYLFAG